MQWDHFMTSDISNLVSDAKLMPPLIPQQIQPAEQNKTQYKIVCPLSRHHSSCWIQHETNAHSRQSPPGPWGSVINSQVLPDAGIRNMKMEVEACELWLSIINKYFVSRREQNWYSSRTHRCSPQPVEEHNRCLCAWNVAWWWWL